MAAVEDYQDSFVAYQKAESRLKQIAKVVREASAVLDLQSHWKYIAVTGVDVNITEHAALSGHARRSIDGSVWPSAKEIAEAVLNYDQAIRNCQSSHDRIPLERRAGLESPPKA